MHKVRKEISDQELLVLLDNQKTEKEAILFLYENYYDYLSIFVITNNGNADDAADTFQEVVIAFVHLVKQGKFRGESSIKTFLYAMNRNTWFNEFKRRTQQGKRDLHFETQRESIDPSVSSAVEKTESGKQLLEVMNSIGEACKKILLLFYYENYSMKDILAEMHYDNEQVVRNKKYKCLKQLSDLIHEQPAKYQQFKTLLNG